MNHVAEAQAVNFAYRNPALDGIDHKRLRDMRLARARCLAELERIVDLPPEPTGPEVPLDQVEINRALNMIGGPEFMGFAREVMRGRIDRLTAQIEALEGRGRERIAA